MEIISPKGFLQIGGIVLVVVAILGFFGIIGPTPESSLFSSFWWFDTGENWAHLVLGIVALGIAYGVNDDKTQKTIVMVLGVVALLVGLYGFISEGLLGANLENPMDNLLHLVIGAWALWAAMKQGGMMMGGSTTMPA